MEQFLTSTVRGLAQGSVYVMVGLGFVIIYRATQVVNFAQPALMVLGGTFTSLFVVSQGLPFIVGLVAAVAVTAAIGAATERIAMRPMVGEPPFSAAMVTVGLFIALTVVANRIIGVELRQVGDPWGSNDQFVAGGVTIFHSDVAILVITGIVVSGLVLFFKYSRLGIAMRATAFDQETALAQGVPVGRMFGLSWAISGGLSALAGMFLGAGPGAAIDRSTAFIALKALPAIILGGLDSIAGAVVGGYVIGLAEAYTKSYQPSWLGANFDQVVPYIVMLLVLLVRPYGLFGTPEIERV